MLNLDRTGGLRPDSYHLVACTIKRSTLSGKRYLSLMLDIEHYLYSYTHNRSSKLMNHIPISGLCWNHCQTFTSIDPNI